MGMLSRNETKENDNMFSRDTHAVMYCFLILMVYYVLLKLILLLGFYLPTGYSLWASAYM